MNDHSRPRRQTPRFSSQVKRGVFQPNKARVRNPRGLRVVSPAYFSFFGLLRLRTYTMTAFSSSDLNSAPKAGMVLFPFVMISSSSSSPN